MNQGTEIKRRKFLAYLVAGKTRREAAALVGVEWGTAKQWLFRDKKFLAVAQVSEHTAREQAFGVVEESLVAIAKAEVKLALTGKDDAVTSKSRLALMRGCGVLVDRQQTDVKGVILSVTGDDLAKILRDSRAEFLQAGGQPLGLADGGGEAQRPTARPGVDTLPAVAPPAQGASGH